MAVTDNTPAGGEYQEPRAARGMRQEADDGWNFHSAGQTGVAAGAGGEYFQSLKDAFQKIAGTVVDAYEATVIPFSRQTYSELRFSALAIAVKAKTNPDLVAHYTLVLEATGDRLNPEFKNIVPGQPIRVNHVTSDAYDSVLVGLVQNAVQANFKNANLLNANAMVVPRGVTLQNPDKIEQIVINALTACVTALQQYNGVGTMNLGKLTGNPNFTLNATFGRHTKTDILGNPVRSSVLIDMISALPNQSRQANLDVINSEANEVKVFELSGFVQPVWSKEAQTPFYGLVPQQQAQITPAFTPELVLTDMSFTREASPSAIILAITAAVATLSDGSNWMQAFMPRKTASEAETKLTDITALNITANIGNDQSRQGFGPKLKPEEFIDNPRAAFGLISTLFEQSLMVSVDCPEAGPQSWYLNLLVQAAFNQGDAYRVLFDAANVLFDGHFADEFKEGDPMFTNVVRIPNGTYVHPDGSIRDLREIDYTAVANTFGAQPEYITDFSNSYVATGQVPVEKLLADREDIIALATHDSATITSYSIRVTLSTQLLSACSRCLAKMRLPIRVNTPMTANTLARGVAVPNYINGSKLTNTHSLGGSFNTASGSAAPAYRHATFGGGGRY